MCSFVNLLSHCLFTSCHHSCLQVSRIWHDIISEKPHYMEQIKSHLKSSAENAKKPYPSLTTTTTTTIRRALCPISNHLPVHPQTFLPPLSSSYKAEQFLRHQPCPTCGSPAKQLNLRRTICTNVKCQMDFCQRCFRRWHDGECAEVIGSRSPKRNQTTLIAGSHKSKKRLRRL